MVIRVTSGNYFKVIPCFCWWDLCLLDSVALFYCIFIFILLHIIGCLLCYTISDLLYITSLEPPPHSFQIAGDAPDIIANICPQYFVIINSLQKVQKMLVGHLRQYKTCTDKIIKTSDLLQKLERALT